MREIEDSRDIDAENFYRLVLIVRGIAICRANNLAKFAEQYTNKPMDESKSNRSMMHYDTIMKQISTIKKRVRY